MKVYRKDGTELKDVIVEFDKAGKPEFVRHKNDDRDPDRQPASDFVIKGIKTQSEKVNDNVIEK